MANSHTKEHSQKIQTDTQNITMATQTELSYTRTIVHSTNEFEIVNCVWTKGSLSADHAHGWSQCHLLVQEGEFKNTFYSGQNVDVVVYTAGQVITTPEASRHEIECLSATGKTLHVYLPKLKSLENSFQFAPTTPAQVKEKINLQLGEVGVGLSQIKNILNQVQDLNVQTHSVYFMNQLFSAIHPESLMSAELIAKSRTTAATFEASPVFTTIEIEVIEKLGQLIGWPKNRRDGVTVTGGSSANFMALHCARQKRNPEYKNLGMSSDLKYKIFISQESHYSFKKAVVAMGFGLNSLVLVKADKTGKMIPAELEAEIKKSIAQGETPLLVSATAGTTVLGAFDPIVELSTLSKKYNMWFHVDGAWGGPVLFSEHRNTLLPQIERCDSMTFDAHKLLGANLTCSFFLTQHTGLLFESNDVSGADYLFHSENDITDMGRQSWQCGRSPDAFNFWTLWKSQGSNGFKKLIDHLYDVQKKSMVWIKDQPRLEIVAEPEFLNLCVRVIPPAGQDESTWSQVVRTRLKEKNLAMVNYSLDENGSFLRLVLAHPEIQVSHVQQIFKWALDVT